MVAQTYFSVMGALIVGLGMGMAMAILIQPLPRLSAPIFAIVFVTLGVLFSRYGVEWLTVP